MFDIGDKVICVDDFFPAFTWAAKEWSRGYPRIKLGSIYTIREFFKDELNLIAVRLQEIKCPIHPQLNYECGWKMYHFRKIDENKKIKKQVKKRNNLLRNNL